MLVANGVAGDSRVQKTAWSMAAAGWDVTLVGRAAGERTEHYRLGAARVVLVPVAKTVSGYEAARVGGGIPALQRRPGYRAARADLARRDAIAARTLRRRASAGANAAARQWLADNPRADRALASLGRGPVAGRLRRALGGALGLADPDGGWRAFNPWFGDLETAMAPLVRDLDPDLIHAHDFHMVGIGARLAAALSRPERPVRWIYDAHEYLAGIDIPAGLDPRAALRRRMLIGVEREYIRRADAVVTVSQEIARRLHADHRLAARPHVVLNAPVTGTAESADSAEGADGPRTLRGDLGLPGETVLLVYSGGMSPRRGVGTVIDALAALPQVHLALIARPDDPDVPALRRQAEEGGTADRVHVLPYVPVDEVSGYIASATIGVIPILHRPNHELSLITKYFEYLHARLPIVTSDVREMASETRRLGVGEVFAAGDPETLAAAVRTVAADPGRYRSVYDGPGDPRADSSWAAQAQSLDGLYRDLLGRAPGPSRPAGPLRLTAEAGPGA
jgi:glycogen synthase